MNTKKKFEIVSFNSPEFKKRLLEIALPYQGNITPINTILNQLKNPPLSCQNAVFEEDYVDEDYQDEFAAFYSKTFKRYPHRCTRIHFFSEVFSPRTRISFRQYRRSYLGFMILRPIDLQRVGRTAIVPPFKSVDNQFITCQSTFTAHLYGNAFTVQAMPFLQQDTQVGACAQASLWMLARYMSQRFGCREFLPSEINALAKSNIALGRSLPAEGGLTPVQVMDALQGMGFPAVIYMRENVDPCSRHIEAAFPIQGNTDAEKRQALELQRTAKLADVAYRYIESGLPVILGTADHAVVAIGHSYNHSVANAQVSIQRIPSFFINDDRVGPYIEMSLFVRQAGRLAFLDVRTVITVAPNEATLRGEEAERMARGSVIRLLEERPNPRKTDTFKDILPQVRPELGSLLHHLEYRTYLMRSVQFQQELHACMKQRDVRRQVAKRLIVLDYPKYIWITEISSPALLDQANKNKRQCLGCVIVDSTAPSPTAGVIAIHFADLFLAQDRDDITRSERAIFPHSTPFIHRLQSE
jgi:hypothetical protein